MNDKTLLVLTPTIQESKFWSMKATEIVNMLQTNSELGLSSEEVIKRIQIFGKNIIDRPRKFSKSLILINQFKSPLVSILLIASIITFYISHLRDALFILAAVAANTMLGFYQEYKAENALDNLKTYLKQRSRIVRNGIEFEIDANDLVPGDIIRLSQGDRIPADSRLIHVNDLQIDESILTGESLSVTKSINSVSENTGLADQRSMVFAGTLVTQGLATAVVCRTDNSTEIGKITDLVATSHGVNTPLQSAIASFSKKAGIILGALTMLVFIIGIILGYSFQEMFLISVAIAVSAVPEGLPVAMTVILAIGVQRMAKRKGVIRKLIVAEALGSTTVILTDKTGTLTMAKMELSKLSPIDGFDENKLLELVLLTTNVSIENRNDAPKNWRMNGKMVETSLVRDAAVRGLDVYKVKNKRNILNSLPFNAVNKFSVALIKEEDKHFLVFFGAADILVQHSNKNVEKQREMLNSINVLASAGELVVGVAIKEIEIREDFTFARDMELNNLEFKGLVTLKDHIRASAKDALLKVEQAGIKTIIMTGDHLGTAKAVAKEVGMNIITENVLDAKELRNLSDNELMKRLPFLRIIARVSPLDKLRVVKLFQQMGEVVAMTGDGVNDAPSIRQANIGIAMGSGTEVARSVSDLVLLDDNFETIVSAVDEGRRIMNNIRKVLVYFLSSISDELLLIGGSLIIGIPLPLNALQMLYLNFFTDSFPAIAFAFEKDIDGLNARHNDLREGLFDPSMRFIIIFIGLSTSALLLILYWWLLKMGYQADIVRTFIFASLGSYGLFLAFSLRSLNKSIFEYPIFSNHYLVWGIGIGFASIIASVYIPFMQTILNTVSLPATWFIGVILIGLLNIGLVELGKFLYRQKR